MIDKAVPIPKEWDARQLTVRDELHQLIDEMIHAETVDITLSEAATETFQDLYGYMPKVLDIRLQAYAGRRSRHLLKVAALLAMMRDAGSSQVIASDIRLAHALLTLTERTMDRAFFGLDQTLYSRVLCAVSELIEGNAYGEVTMKEIQAQAGHLAPKVQLNEMLESLVIQKKLKSVRSEGRDSDTWTLQAEHSELGASGLKMAFLAGAAPGIPQPDEFRTHKSGVRGVVKKEGSTG